MYNTENLDKAHITDYLCSDFPNLRTGKEVDDITREAAVRTVVEIHCSQWAPYNIFGSDSVEEFIKC